MPRQISIVRTKDIANALRAAVAAGLTVFGYDVDAVTGKISVITSEPPKRREAGETPEDVRALI